IDDVRSKTTSTRTPAPPTFESDYIVENDCSRAQTPFFIKRRFGVAGFFRPGQTGPLKADTKIVNDASPPRATKADSSADHHVCGRFRWEGAHRPAAQRRAGRCNVHPEWLEPRTDRWR